MRRDKIKVGITHGDINGVGYEVIIKALEDSRMLDLCTPIVYGSPKVWSFYKKQINIEGGNYNLINQAKECHRARVNLINCSNDEIKVELGKISEEAGVAAYEALERATNDLANGDIDVLVTAPISKYNIQSKNFNHPGHTEYLSEKFAQANDEALMMLVSDNLRIAVATGHIPVSEVASTLTTELILKKLRLLNNSLKKDAMIVRPRIAVLGLNPHAGDSGLIGKEEQEIIIPALKQAEEEGMLVFGTYAADGFFGAGLFRKFDAILAMYHDQGLIPFKTLAMDAGVNFTAGLNIVRTSPAHGTAFDIAGENLASPQSMLKAIYHAIDVIRNRERYEEMNANPLQVHVTETRRNSIQ